MTQSDPSCAVDRMWARCQIFVPAPTRAPSSTSALGCTKTVVGRDVGWVIAQLTGSGIRVSGAVYAGESSRQDA